MTVALAKCGQAEVTWFDNSSDTLRSATLGTSLLSIATPASNHISQGEIRKIDYQVANAGAIGQATEWTKSLFALSLAGVGVAVSALTGANSGNLAQLSKFALLLAIFSLASTAISSIKALEFSEAALNEEMRASKEGREPSLAGIGMRLYAVKWIQTYTFYLGLCSISFSALSHVIFK